MNDLGHEMAAAGWVRWSLPSRFEMGCGGGQTVEEKVLVGCSHLLRRVVHPSPVDRLLSGHDPSAAPCNQSQPSTVYLSVLGVTPTHVLDLTSFPPFQLCSCYSASLRRVCGSVPQNPRSCPLLTLLVCFGCATGLCFWVSRLHLEPPSPVRPCTSVLDWSRDFAVRPSRSPSLCCALPSDVTAYTSPAPYPQLILGPAPVCPFVTVPRRCNRSLCMCVCFELRFATLRNHQEPFTLLFSIILYMF
ncbi:hypothetical protein B0T17DRAFT_327234 [Bombardia bombarda]|uniref:Uncharacterized protein n=1 Tax=Bombardia bombarda TaxID=252184 RepID=A0AA39WMU8_9PEZI|nr:hypothetical protein B0T17DRAFT_327234 [Bombardia bombarda]